MKTLEQHNSERMERIRNRELLNQPHPNGIECPKCGKELWDSSPRTTLASNPCQKNVHCPECNYAGYRIA